MNSKHTLFFENVPAGFIELAFTLVCALRICTFSKWKIFIRVTDLGMYLKIGTARFAVTFA